MEIFQNHSLNNFNIYLSFVSNSLAIDGTSFVKYHTTSNTEEMNITIPNEQEIYAMSGIKYEIQNRDLQSFKHTFDYNFCKQKYDEYASMDIKTFTQCLKDPNKLGEIGHLCCFILWVKNKEQYEYRETLGDYGLIHLLFHCLENEHSAEIHAEYIHMLFKEDIKLV